MSGIQGKVIAITGASSGIGEAAARELARRGAHVVLGARRTDRLERLVAEITAAGGSVDLIWVPRADNSAADALSNRGMDGDTVAEWHDEPRSAPDRSVSGTEPDAGVGLSPGDLGPSTDTDQLPVRPPRRPGEPIRPVSPTE